MQEQVEINQFQQQISFEEEIYEKYQSQFQDSLTCIQQMYSKYQDITKLHQQIIQNDLCISEKFIILILEQQQYMSQVARELQKENEYNQLSSIFIKFLQNKSEKYQNEILKDDIYHFVAKSYLQEKNFKKAAEVYLQRIQICERRVPQKWIPQIIEIFKKQNDYIFISNFCLQQFGMRNSQSEGIDFYLLLNIIGKKVDLKSVTHFIQTNNIQKVIDDIISNYNDIPFLNELYNKSVQQYLQKPQFQQQSNNLAENEAQKFFYSLLQSYANILKQQNLPNSIYINYLQQLKSLSEEEIQDNINLEIAKVYQEQKEIELSISYYEMYLIKKPNNLGTVFDLYYQYQSSENSNIHKRMYDFFKMLLINNPQLTVYYGILIQDNNMSFNQLKSLIKEYLQKNIKYFQYLFKFIDFINNTIYTQNSFFNNRDLIKSYIKFELENANAIYQRAVCNKMILPYLIYQPIYSLNDIYFD